MYGQPYLTHAAIYATVEAPDSRATFGDKVLILDTSNTRKLVPRMIGERCLIRSDLLALGLQDPQPYQVDDSNAWLFETDVRMQELMLQPRVSEPEAQENISARAEVQIWEDSLKSVEQEWEDAEASLKAAEQAAATFEARAKKLEEENETLRQASQKNENSAKNQKRRTSKLEAVAEALRMALEKEPLDSEALRSAEQAAAASEARAKKLEDENETLRQAFEDYKKIGNRRVDKIAARAPSPRPSHCVVPEERISEPQHGPSDSLAEVQQLQESLKTAEQAAVAAEASLRAAEEAGAAAEARAKKSEARTETLRKAVVTGMASQAIVPDLMGLERERIAEIEEGLGAAKAQVNNLQDSLKTSEQAAAAAEDRAKKLETEIETLRAGSTAAQRRASLDRAAKAAEEAAKAEEDARVAAAARAAEEAAKAAEVAKTAEAAKAAEAAGLAEKAAKAEENARVAETARAAEEAAKAEEDARTAATARIAEEAAKAEEDNRVAATARAAEEAARAEEDARVAATARAAQEAAKAEEDARVAATARAAEEAAKAEEDARVAATARAAEEAAKAEEDAKTVAAARAVEEAAKAEEDVRVAAIARAAEEAAKAEEEARVAATAKAAEEAAKAEEDAKVAATARDGARETTRAARPSVDAIRARLSQEDVQAQEVLLFGAVLSGDSVGETAPRKKPILRRQSTPWAGVGQVSQESGVDAQTRRSSAEGPQRKRSSTSIDQAMAMVFGDDVEQAAPQQISMADNGASAVPSASVTFRDKIESSMSYAVTESSVFPSRLQSASSLVDSKRSSLESSREDSSHPAIVLENEPETQQISAGEDPKQNDYASRRRDPSHPDYAPENDPDHEEFDPDYAMFMGLDEEEEEEQIPAKENVSAPKNDYATRRRDQSHPDYAPENDPNHPDFDPDYAMLMGWEEEEEEEQITARENVAAPKNNYASRRRDTSHPDYAPENDPDHEEFDPDYAMMMGWEEEEDEEEEEMPTVSRTASVKLTEAFARAQAFSKRTSQLVQSEMHDNALSMTSCNSEGPPDRILRIGSPGVGISNRSASSEMSEVDSDSDPQHSNSDFSMTSALSVGSYRSILKPPTASSGMKSVGLKSMGMESCASVKSVGFRPKLASRMSYEASEADEDEWSLFRRRGEAAMEQLKSSSSAGEEDGDMSPTRERCPSITEEPSRDDPNHPRYDASHPDYAPEDDPSHPDYDPSYAEMMGFE